MQVGNRVRLMGELMNPSSDWMPKEDLEPGLEGEIIHLNLSGPKEFHQISVKWDNGRVLGLFPDDPFVVIRDEEEKDDEIIHENTDNLQGFET